MTAKVYRIRSAILGVQPVGAHAGMVAVLVDFDADGTELAATAFAEQVSSLMPEAPFWAVLRGDAQNQIDHALVTQLHARRARISVETDGTVLLPRGVDWVTVVPRRGLQRAAMPAKELRVVLPGWDGASLQRLASSGQYGHLYVQPEHAVDLPLCTAWALAHPRWRVCAVPSNANGAGTRT